MFRKKSYVGIAITDQDVKAAWVESRKSSHTISTHGVETFEEGVISAGQIVNDSLFLDTLSRLVSKGKLKNKKVHLALPSALSIVRYMNFPVVSKSKLRKLIDFEVKHNMYLPFNDPNYSYIILPSKVNMTMTRTEADASDKKTIQQQYRVMLVVNSRSVVSQYVQLLKAAKLKVLSIELDPFALYRVLSHAVTGLATKTIMTLHILDEQTEVSVYKNSYIKITRRIALNLTAEPTAAYNHEFNQLASEIERIMSFFTYSMNNRSDDIQTIYIFGQSERLEQLGSFLKNHLQHEVVMGSEIGFSSPIELFDTHAVPIGLSLRRSK